MTNANKKCDFIHYKDMSPQISLNDKMTHLKQQFDFRAASSPSKRNENKYEQDVDCSNRQECPPKVVRKIKRKKLPKLNNGDCPCIEKHVPTESPPLRPLVKKTIIYHKPKPCKKECQARADDGLKVVQKTLPQIVAGECPCTTYDIKDAPPLPRLIKREIKLPPPRVCVEKCVPVTPRADEGLKPVKKKLPELTLSPCPCIETKEMIDVPLVRLEKRKIIQTYRCKIPPCITNPRADEGMKIVPKQLPKISVGNCPCIEKDIAEYAPVLPKLKKRPMPPPPPPACDKIIQCTTRADDGLTVNKKKLPKMDSSDCPCVEKKSLAEGMPFKRLEKRPVPEQKCRLPPVCPMNRRADDDLKVILKTLPKLELGDCPCVEKKELRDSPPLIRLQKRIFQPPPVEVCSKVGCDTKRADNGLKVTRKTLPILATSNCPCIEPKELSNAPPLPRLIKAPVHEKSRPCPKPYECAERADANLKVTKKTLPVLRPSSCPCINEQIPTFCPPLKRPRKNKLLATSRSCCEPCECPPRADDDSKSSFSYLSNMNKTYMTLSSNKTATNKCLSFLTTRNYSTFLSRMLKNLYTCKPIYLNISVKHFSEQCSPNKESKLPPLKRLQKRPGFDEEIAHYERPFRYYPLTYSIEVDHPRMDDVMNYKPKFKKLPVLIPKCWSVSVHKVKEQETRLERRSAYEGTNKIFPNIPKKLPTVNFSPGSTYVSRGRRRFIDVPKLKRHQKITITNSRSEYIPIKKIKMYNHLKPEEASSYNEQDFDQIKQPVVKRLPRAPFLDNPPWETLTTSKCEDEQGSRRTDIPAKYMSKRKPLECKKKYSTLCFNDSIKLLNQENDPKKVLTNSLSTSEASMSYKREKQCPKGDRYNKNPSKHSPGASLACTKKIRNNQRFKQHSPYPSYSECTDDGNFHHIGECLDEQLRFLQPKYPIISDASGILKEPPPHQEHISFKETCAKNRKPACSKDYLTASHEVKENVIKEVTKNLSVADNMTPILKQKCLSTSDSGKNVLSFKAKEKKDCSLKNKSTKPKCQDAMQNKPKCSEIKQNRECPVVMNKSKCLKVVQKKPKCANILKMGHKKTMWEKICDYFRAKPNCPAPDEWKKKKLRAEAEKAAAAAGLSICDNNIYSERRCRKRSIETKKELPKVVNETTCRNLQIITDQCCIPKKSLNKTDNCKKSQEAQVVSDKDCENKQQSKIITNQDCKKISSNNCKVGEKNRLSRKSNPDCDKIYAKRSKKHTDSQTKRCSSTEAKNEISNGKCPPRVQ